jgi:excisionase family DNA binding protein
VQSIGKQEGNREPAFISVRETAGLLKVSPLTVYRRFHAGQFPGRRFGRKIDLYRPFVNELLAAICSGGNVDVELFAAEWAQRNAAPEAVA